MRERLAKRWPPARPAARSLHKLRCSQSPTGRGANCLCATARALERAGWDEVGVAERWPLEGCGRVLAAQGDATPARALTAVLVSLSLFKMAPKIDPNEIKIIYLRAVGGEVGASSALAPKIGPLGLVSGDVRA